MFYNDCDGLGYYLAQQKDKKKKTKSDKSPATLCFPPIFSTKPFLKNDVSRD